MVLDASASLGDEFSTIKNYAKNFADNIFNAIPGAKIGIVDFSDAQHVLMPTSDRNDILEHIDNMQQGNFTMLYEAMNTGIDILQASEADARAILTFTDGTDNISNPTYTPAFLHNKLTNSTNGNQINSFTIGLEGNGGVDRVILEDLAANGGVAEFPKNVAQLQGVFQKFSQSISNVYNLTYIRNQQVVNVGKPLKLKFVINASPK
jgi:Mg-chelatase subunit ChlD